MKLSYNWLKELIDIKVTPDQLAQDLNSFGHEVEEVKKVGNDYILDISITANRGDCLSVLGLAREITALYNLKLKTKNEKPQYKTQNLEQKIKVKIEDKKICPRYSTRIISGISIKDSPSWMQQRLKSVGIRPINNIVDITNYVMLESGQPLHAFDCDKIHDGKMYIRLAKTGESVITLDGKKRELDEKSIIIEDGKKIFDLAGIMGGANSEVDKNTKTIVLQAAIFDRKLVRFTSKRLKHMTDASYRYERGVDYQGTLSALDNATNLIIQCCSHAKISELINIQSDKWQPTVVPWKPEKDIRRLLGVEIPYEKIMQYLQRLDITCLKCSLDKKACQMQVPSWRHDLVIHEDLVEEVARIHGYNKIPKYIPNKINPLQSALKSAFIRDQFVLKEILKDKLVENGFTEVYSYSFVDKKLMQMMDIDLAKCRRVVNSVAPELEYLRYDLRLSILTAIAKNPWSPEIQIFEIGRVFNTDGEKNQLIIAQCSKNDQSIKQILTELGINSDIISPDQKVLDYIKIRRPVKYAIIDLDEKILKNVSILSGQSNSPRGWAFDSREVDEVKYRPVSQFPPTIRDLAFIVNKDINAQKIPSHISDLDSHIFLVEQFDEFVSNKFGTDKKNVAYHIWLQDMQKPMNPKEVDKIISKIIKEIESKFNAKLR